MRWQLALKFKPVFAGGDDYQEVPFDFGPFTSYPAAQEWCLAFIDCFQEEFEQEPEIEQCTLSEPYAITPYNPQEPILSPKEPWLAAQGALDVLMFYLPKTYKADAVGPFIWRALARLNLAEFSYPIDMPVVAGPFESPRDITVWVTQMNDVIKNKIAHLDVVNLEFQNEEIVKEIHHISNEEEYRFNIAAKITEEAEEFFSELMRDMLTARNAKK